MRISYDQVVSESGGRVRYVYPLSVGAERATEIDDFSVQVRAGDTRATLEEVETPRYATTKSGDDRGFSACVFGQALHPVERLRRLVRAAAGRRSGSLGVRALVGRVQRGRSRRRRARRRRGGVLRAPAARRSAGRHVAAARSPRSGHRGRREPQPVQGNAGRRGEARRGSRRRARSRREVRRLGLRQRVRHLSGHRARFADRRLRRGPPQVALGSSPERFVGRRWRAPRRGSPPRAERSRPDRLHRRRVADLRRAFRERRDRAGPIDARRAQGGSSVSRRRASGRRGRHRRAGPGARRRLRTGDDGRVDRAARRRARALAAQPRDPRRPVRASRKLQRRVPAHPAQHSSRRAGRSGRAARRQRAGRGHAARRSRRSPVHTHQGGPLDARGRAPESARPAAVVPRAHHRSREIDRRRHGETGDRSLQALPRHVALHVAARSRERPDVRRFRNQADHAARGRSGRRSACVWPRDGNGRAAERSGRRPGGKQGERGGTGQARGADAFRADGLLHRQGGGACVSSRRSRPRRRHRLRSRPKPPSRPSTRNAAIARQPVPLQPLRRRLRRTHRCPDPRGRAESRANPRWKGNGPSSPATDGVSAADWAASA